ncbi:MAG: CocE/NonD family hydrolase [Acidobacteria bacterium]|nr:CocE/NonD family hydrolase [Acidobacteriota bacterium]
MRRARAVWVGGCVALALFSPDIAARRPVQQQGAPESGTTVRTDVNVMVPMRDGVRLSTDIYRPDTPGRFPVVLTRTPYNNNDKQQIEFGHFFARHGFVYVTQDCRGRYDSDGDWGRPLIHDPKDGHDTIDWVAKQPWSSGRVGTFGISYHAWNQWMAAPGAPSSLRTMISIVAPADPFLDAPYHGGAFELLMARWMLMMSTRTNQDYSFYDLPKLYWHLPLRTLDEAAGRRVDWWRDWTEHDTFDDYWKQTSYMDRYAQITVPVLHIDGWFDDDLVASLRNYVGMTAQGGSPEARRGQRLLVGPWPHGVNSSRTLGDIDFGPDALIDLKAVYLRWFECHLREQGCAALMSEPPVKIFVMGENRWRGESEWPLRRAQQTVFYFHSQGRANTLSGDGTLTTEKPADEPADRYSYDPADPVPTVYRPGDPPKGTTEDQRPVENREDVLVFSTGPLDDSMEVTGPIEVKLWAASSAPDTDWTAKLVDVHPNGYAQRVMDGIIRARFRSSYERPSLLEPEKVYEHTIDLWAVSHVFHAGHRVRVEISSSNFPKYSRNLNTGQNSATTTAMQVARQTVHHDRARPSHIVLPRVPTKGGS